MPQPTPNAMHIDRWLTNVAVAWSQDNAAFIADKIFPVVPVLKMSDKILKYPKGFFYRDEVGERPLGGRPRQAGYALESGSYSCKEFALEHPIDDQQRANADQPLNPDLAGMRLLTTQMMIKREKDFVTKFFTTGVWGVDWTGVNEAEKSSEHKFGQFDSAEHSGEPIRFFQLRINEIRKKTGYKPNVLVLGPDVFIVLANHKEVVDRIKYTQRGVVTEETLAALIGIDRIVVPGGVENKAKEGLTDEIDYIASAKDALLIYAAAAPTIDDPSGGYCFAWVGLVPGGVNAFGGVLERGRESLAHSDILQIRSSYDMQIMATDLGVYFHECVAS